MTSPGELAAAGGRRRHRTPESDVTRLDVSPGGGDLLEGGLGGFSLVGARRRLTRGRKRMYVRLQGRSSEDSKDTREEDRGWPSERDKGVPLEAPEESPSEGLGGGSAFEGPAAARRIRGGGRCVEWGETQRARLEVNQWRMNERDSAKGGISGRGRQTDGRKGRRG